MSLTIKFSDLDVFDPRPSSVFEVSIPILELGPGFFEKAPTITAAGRNLFAMNAASTFVMSGFSIALGTGLYEPEGDETALQAEVVRISAADASIVANDQIRISATLGNGAANGAKIGEVGIYYGSTLVAILSKPSTPMFAKIANVDIPLKFTVDISVVETASIPDLFPLYKGALAASGGAGFVGYSDPVAPAFLKTVSDIINGERVSVLRAIATDKHAGIRAGTNTDDLQANIVDLINAMRDAKYGDLYFPRGMYTSGKLTIPGNFKMSGNGATIKAAATLAANQPLMINQNFGGAANTTIDDNINIEGIAFLCDIAADRSVELVSFIKCGNLNLERVRVIGPRYVGLAIGGCKGARLVDIVASGCGKQAVTVEGGAAIWIGPYLGDGSTSDDTWIDRPRISSCEWAGIYTTGQRVTISRPHIINVKEAGIFGTSSTLDINGGVISGITRKYISSAGIELGGINATIGGGLIISGTDNVSISLADFQGATISGIKTMNARRDAATFPGAGHISIISLSASPLMCRDILINGHSAIDYSLPSYAAVAVDGQAPGGAAINVKIGEGNNYSGTPWTSGKAISINPTYWNSASCEHRGNLGADDSASGVTAVVTTAVSTASAVATTLNFDSAGPNTEAMWVVGSPSRITVPENVRRVKLSAQVTFTGSATGIRQVNILKNGALGYSGRGSATVPTAGAGYSQAVNVETGVLDVVAGDYFQLQCLQDSGGALPITVGGSWTWLSLDVK
jgi:hypothetical protein